MDPAAAADIVCGPTPCSQEQPVTIVNSIPPSPDSEPRAIWQPLWLIDILCFIFGSLAAPLLFFKNGGTCELDYGGAQCDGSCIVEAEPDITGIGVRHYRYPLPRNDTVD